MAGVFISYVRDDAEIVYRLAAALRERGIPVWLDRYGIAPGLRWRSAIRDAIREGDFFVACFSDSSARRERSYMNAELLIAIDELRLRPADKTWFIPVKLDGTQIPDRDIGGGETLRDLQWVELQDNWEEGVNRITNAMWPKLAPWRPIDPKQSRCDAAGEARGYNPENGHVLASPAGIVAAEHEVRELQMQLKQVVNARWNETHINVDSGSTAFAWLANSPSGTLLLEWPDDMLDASYEACLTVYIFSRGFTLEHYREFSATIEERIEFWFDIRQGIPGWVAAPPHHFETSRDLAERLVAQLSRK